MLPLLNMECIKPRVLVQRMVPYTRKDMDKVKCVQRRRKSGSPEACHVQNGCRNCHTQPKLEKARKTHNNFLQVFLKLNMQDMRASIFGQNTGSSNRGRLICQKCSKRVRVGSLEINYQESIPTQRHYAFMNQDDL